MQELITDREIVKESKTSMLKEIVISLDLGKMNDYTVLVVAGPGS